MPSASSIARGMSRPTNFSIAQICAMLEKLGTAERAVPAVRRAAQTLSRDRPRAALADLVKVIHDDAGTEISDHLMSALQHLALRDGITLAMLWRRLGRQPLILHGYNEAKWEEIVQALQNPSAQPYGATAGGLDERAVEYPWIFERIAAVHPAGEPVLDAGSVMNYSEIAAEWERRKPGPLSIVTLRHEGHAYPSDDMRYEYADLRRLPYRDGWFATALSVSTLEHVGMDTAIYGGDIARAADPEAEMALALRELDRVTAGGGNVLVSVPFGAADDRGWLRVLDFGQVDRIGAWLPWSRTSLRVFRAFEEGWREVAPEAAADAGYNEPTFRPGRRTAPDFVAAAEAVALLEFRKDV